MRLANETVNELDGWIQEGRFKSRSDAIRSILAFYEEREKTLDFYKMLRERSKDAKERPEIFIPLEDM